MHYLLGNVWRKNHVNVSFCIEIFFENDSRDLLFFRMILSTARREAEQIWVLVSCGFLLPSQLATSTAAPLGTKTNVEEDMLCGAPPTGMEVKILKEPDTGRKNIFLTKYYSDTLWPLQHPILTSLVIYLPISNFTYLIKKHVIIKIRLYRDDR